MWTRERNKAGAGLGRGENMQKQSKKRTMWLEQRATVGDKTKKRQGSDFINGTTGFRTLLPLPSTYNETLTSSFLLYLFWKTLTSLQRLQHGK